LLHVAIDEHDVAALLDPLAIALTAAASARRSTV
jgi:hypothetical protein